MAESPQRQGPGAVPESLPSCASSELTLSQSPHGKAGHGNEPNGTGDRAQTGTVSPASECGTLIRPPLVIIGSMPYAAGLPLSSSLQVSGKLYVQRGISDSREGCHMEPELPTSQKNPIGWA